MTQTISAPAAVPTPVRGAARLTNVWVQLPWWAHALIVFALSRVLTTGLFLWVGTQATAQSRAGLHPSLGALANAWDGVWYWSVAFSGYPTTLPLDAAGDVTQNVWAFLPLYPFVVKVFALGNIYAWPAVAPFVSVMFGFGAAVLLALLLRRRLSASATTFAVLVFSVSPLSFILQTAYAESMGIFLTLAVLCLVDRRRYIAAIPVVIALGFTRPGVLAIALTVLVQLLIRLGAARRSGDRVPRDEVLGAAALVGVTIVVGFAWAVIAGIVTGVPDAYIKTEVVWRELWMGHTTFAYFTPWVFAVQYLATAAGLPAVAGTIFLVALIVGFAAVLVFSPAVRRLGVTIRLWSASYVLYLLAVFFPQSSILRLLMPLAPLAGAMQPKTRASRIVLIVVSIGLQALWLWCTYGPFQAYWGVP